VRAGPGSAAALVEDFLPLDGPPRPARDLLLEIVIAQGWASELEAYERAERWEGRFVTKLRARLTDEREHGRFTAYDFNSSSDYMIQGACFAEPHDSAALREMKRRRLQHGGYGRALAAIRPIEFEAVCRGVLRTLGVADPALTPYAADEGIDFYGQLRLSGIGAERAGLPRFQDVLAVWLVGQAKHYPAGRAATPEVRELVGSVVLARAGAYSRVDPIYENLRIRPCDPVFFLFFTTGRISSAGWRLLQSSGVVGMDGMMLAAFLADSGVGMVDGRFDPDQLNQWVAAQ
jgi:Restriction endonuclease